MGPDCRSVVFTSRLHLEIPQVRGLRFYPKLERGPFGEGPLAIAEMYVMGVSLTEITEQLCGLEICLESRDVTKSWKSFEAGSWESIRSCIDEKVRRGGRVQDVAILKA